jgi:hypothetical protein
MMTEALDGIPMTMSVTETYNVLAKGLMPIGVRCKWVKPSNLPII